MEQSNFPQGGFWPREDPMFNAEEWLNNADIDEVASIDKSNETYDAEAEYLYYKLSDFDDDSTKVELQKYRSLLLKDIEKQFGGNNG